MSNSITDWSNCLHGGSPGSNGHRVPLQEMTQMLVGKTTIRICATCKAKKLERILAEKKARRSAQDIYARVELDHKETL